MLQRWTIHVKQKRRQKKLPVTSVDKIQGWEHCFLIFLFFLISWKNNTCVIVVFFFFFLSNQVLRTFLSIPEGVCEKKRIFLFIPAHFEGIWFLIWLDFRCRDSGWWELGSGLRTGLLLVVEIFQQPQWSYLSPQFQEKWNVFSRPAFCS